MRIPFDIKYRPQIESGEYKVETRDGRKARIIHWDLNCASPIVAVMDAHIDLTGEIVDVFSVSGMAFDDLESPSDLFLVTPEPELSEFESKVKYIVDNLTNNITYRNVMKERFNRGNEDEQIKEYASELLAIAKEQLNIENLKDRAVELTKQLNESGLDENSIEYNLIEFMCNLMDCPNWNEIVETTGLYAGRIKAEAVKDLPGWKKWGKGIWGNPDGHPIALVAGCGGIRFVSCLGTTGEKFIFLSDLKKLPGFKEDSHE